MPITNNLNYEYSYSHSYVNGRTDRDVIALGISFKYSNNYYYICSYHDDQNMVIILLFVLGLL